MNEDNFDIYDDLEHFEIGEKLKEKNDEIDSLTERLNLSVVTITELEQKNKVLKKKNEVLLKNTSSLLLTAKLELNRKLRENNLLQEKRDNKSFRRPNSFSVAIQTDTLNLGQIVTNSEKTVDNVTTDDKQISVNSDRTPQIVESSDRNPRTAERCDEISVIADAANNVRENLKNFRIPKKNPNARLVDINDRTRADACTNDKLKEIQLDTKDQQKNSNCLKKYHIPKKNPSARHLDIVEVVSNFTYDDRCVERIKDIKLCDKVQTERQKNVKVDNAKPRSHRRMEDDKDKRAATRVNGRRTDNRRRSPAPYSLDRRADKDRHFYSDERRGNGRSRSTHKRYRDRDSSDERDRHAKVFRSRSKHRSRSKSKSRSKSVSSRSKPKSSRSESKSSQREDKLAGSTENDVKCNELEKVEKVLPKVSVSLSKLKDKELEDMLISKTKILEETVNKVNAKPHEIQEQIRHEEDAPEEPRKKICLSTYQKRKSLPLADVSDKLEEQRSEDPINSFKEVTSFNGPEDNFVVKTSEPTVKTICLSDVDNSKERPKGSESSAVPSVPSVSANEQCTSNQKLTPTAVVPSIHSASVLSETLDDKILQSVVADYVPNSNEKITPVAVVNLIDSESENLDDKPLPVAANNQSNSNEEITAFTVVPSIDSTSLQSDIALPSLTANDQCNSNTEITPFTPSVGSAFISTESSDGKVAIPLIETPNIENNANQIESNENSSNGMDIDYDLTRRSSVGDELNEQNNKLSAFVDVQNDPHAENHQSSCELSNKIPETMSMDIVDNVMENHVVTNSVVANHVPEKAGIGENEMILNGSNEITMNGSFERHVLSRSIEYTVQDVGDEVHIYLTKKRRKHKRVKVVVL